MSRSDQ